MPSGQSHQQQTSLALRALVLFTFCTEQVGDIRRVTRTDCGHATVLRSFPSMASSWGQLACCMSVRTNSPLLPVATLLGTLASLALCSLTGDGGL